MLNYFVEAEVLKYAITLYFPTIGDIGMHLKTSSPLAQSREALSSLTSDQPSLHKPAKKKKKLSTVSFSQLC